LVLLIGILTVGIAAFSWFAFWQMTRKTYGRKVLKNWHETNNMLLGMLDKNNIAYMTKSYNRYWLALSQVQNKIVLKESKYWVLLTGRSNSDLSVVYVKDVSMIDYPNLKKFLRLIDSCFPDNKIQ
jgi:hypothetical protein